MASGDTTEQMITSTKRIRGKEIFPTERKRATAPIRQSAHGEQRLSVKGSQKMNKPDFSFVIQKLAGGG